MKRRKWILKRKDIILSSVISEEILTYNAKNLHVLCTEGYRYCALLTEFAAQNTNRWCSTELLDGKRNQLGQAETFELHIEFYRLAKDHKALEDCRLSSRLSSQVDF